MVGVHSCASYLFEGWTLNIYEVHRMGMVWLLIKQLFYSFDH